MLICPKCHHQRSPQDDPEIPETQCPGCGIFYAKYRPSKERPPPKPPKERPRPQPWLNLSRLTAAAKRSRGLWVAVILLLIGLQIVMDLPPHPSASELQAIRAERILAEQKAAARCRADLKCTAEKYLDSIFSPCSRLIEQQARYLYKWKGSRFTYFSWLDEKKPAIAYVGDGLQFQNGFGAWQNMRYACNVDLESNTIMKIIVSPGRFPFIE